MSIDARAWFLVSIVVSSAACSSKAEADQLCNLAREIAADQSVADDQKFQTWVTQAQSSVKGRKLGAALETLATTTADSAFVEALISDAIGEDWTCSPIEELDPPLPRPSAAD